MDNNEFLLCLWNENMKIIKTLIEKFHIDTIGFDGIVFVRKNINTEIDSRVPYV